MAAGPTIEGAHEEAGAPPSLREKNRSERRDALVDAAYALFRERGFAATTMDDVADRAGLSRRTAFRYFVSKDELVFPRRDARLVLLREQLVPRAGETAVDTVRRACLAIARDYAADREHMLEQWRIVQAEPALIGRELQLDRAFEEAIESAFVAAEGESARARRRARVRAAAIVGAVRATLREWLEGGATADLVRLGRETFAELERGLRSGGEDR